jgi:hypothetical protein
VGYFTEVFGTWIATFGFWIMAEFNLTRRNKQEIRKKSMDERNAKPNKPHGKRIRREM